VSRYQKGKTNLYFTEATDSEWQWHQLGHMQVCTSLQTDNHASTPPLSFLQAGCPFCRPTNSAKALKAHITYKSLRSKKSNMCQVKQASKRGIAVRKGEATRPQRYGNSHAIWDDTVLPATRQT